MKFISRAFESIYVRIPIRAHQLIYIFITHKIFKITHENESGNGNGNAPTTIIRTKMDAVPEKNIEKYNRRSCMWVYERLLTTMTRARCDRGNEKKTFTTK